METKDDILNELKELSTTLATISKQNVYTVPDGYFTTLADDIAEQIKIENISFTKANTYQTPNGYFDNLANDILAKIKNEEIEFPILASIGNKNVYAVPQGYFENVSTQILDKAKTTNETKVVSIKGASNWMKYAAAAVFVGIVTFSVVKFSGNKDATTFTKEQFATAIKTDVEKGLDELSDEAIINYLQQDNTAEADVTASLVNEEELPDEIDYLLDENTLDDFLNNTDSKKN